MNSEKLTVSLAVRWFVSLLFCGLMSMFVLSAFYNRAGFLVAQLCSAGMYFALVIQACYSIGLKDHNRYIFGKGDNRPFKGLLSAIIVSIPTFASAAALLICRFADQGTSQALIIYRLVNAPYYALNLMLLPTALSLGEMHFSSIAVSMLLMLLMPLIAGLSYLAGLSNSDLFAGLVRFRKKAV